VIFVQVGAEGVIVQLNRVDRGNCLDDPPALVVDSEPLCRTCAARELNLLM
jgi:hypothetical protein